MSDYDDGQEVEEPDFAAIRSPAERATAAERYASQLRLEVDRSRLQAAGLVSAYDVSDTPPTKAPGQEGLDHFDRALAAGSRREDAAAHVINRIVDAAIKGDQRVILADRKLTER